MVAVDMTTVTIDEQGRMVLPRRIRDRMGLPRGKPARLHLWDSPDGVMIEPEPRSAVVAIEDDGMPVIRIDDVGQIDNQEVIAAIHTERARR